MPISINTSLEHVLTATTTLNCVVCYRLLCRDSGGETESMLLNETVPPWVIDITVDVSTTVLPYIRADQRLNTQQVGVM